MNKIIGRYKYKIKTYGVNVPTYCYMILIIKYKLPNDRKFRKIEFNITEFMTNSCVAECDQFVRSSKEYIDIILNDGINDFLTYAILKDIKKTEGILNMFNDECEVFDFVKTNKKWNSFNIDTEDYNTEHELSTEITKLRFKITKRIEESRNRINGNKF